MKGFEIGSEVVGACSGARRIVRSETDAEGKAEMSRPGVDLAARYAVGMFVRAADWTDEAERLARRFLRTLPDDAAHRDACRELADWLEPRGLAPKAVASLRRECGSWNPVRDPDAVGRLAGFPGQGFTED